MSFAEMQERRRSQDLRDLFATFDLIQRSSSPLRGSRSEASRRKQLSIGRRRALALRLEGLGHGGLRREAALLGDVGEAAVGVLVDEADGIAHTVLADHVVERMIAAAADDLS